MLRRAEHEKLLLIIIPVCAEAFKRQYSEG
jgi:hypothetical protein